MEEKELLVIKDMQKYGGSFVRSLANCFQSADPENFERLKKAFTEYWDYYSRKVKRG